MKRTILFTLLFLCPVFAQNEVLTNSDVIEMARAGLGAKVILEKIKTSDCDFDTSTKSLVALKQVGVDDEVISEIIGKSKTRRERVAKTTEEEPKEFVKYSESRLTPDISQPRTPAEILKNAKTIAITKSSLHPNRQNLEKALFKREEWRKLNLTITEYRGNADLILDISYVSLSWLTHRYTFRIYDPLTGVVLTAGETTSWGSLHENLAKNIIAGLKKIGG